MKKLLIVFLVCLFPVSGSAEWTYITVGGAGGVVYVDFSTLERKGNHVKFWTKTVYETPQTHHYGFRYDSHTVYKEINCVEKKYRELHYTAFLKDTQAYSHPFMSLWAYIPAGTVSFDVMKRLCRK